VPRFELGELDRASSVGDLDEHPNNSFKTAFWRRLPAHDRKCDGAVGCFMGSRPIRNAVVPSLFRMRLAAWAGKSQRHHRQAHSGGPLNSATVNVSARSPLNLRFPTFYRKREPLGRPPQPGTGSKRKIGTYCASHSPGVDEHVEFSVSKDAPGAGARPFYFEEEPGWRMAIN